jgi:hypothetical protein
MAATAEIKVVRLMRSHSNERFRSTARFEGARLSTIDGRAWISDGWVCARVEHDAGAGDALDADNAAALKRQDIRERCWRSSRTGAAVLSQRYGPRRKAGR